MDEYIAMDVAVALGNVSAKSPTNVNMNVTQTRALVKHTMVMMPVVIIAVVMSVVEPKAN